MMRAWMRLTGLRNRRGEAYGRRVYLVLEKDGGVSWTHDRPGRRLRRERTEQAPNRGDIVSIPGPEGITVLARVRADGELRPLFNQPKPPRRPGSRLVVYDERVAPTLPEPPPLPPVTASDHEGDV